MKNYDLIAIGGGSGGLAVAEQAAKLGKRVALIDPNPLGGTCVNAGCVPKKVMWYAAESAASLQHAQGFSLDVADTAVDWASLVSARNDYIQPINRYWAAHCASLGIEHYVGKGRLLDSYTVEVNGQQIRADHIVLASGGRPVVPPVQGAELGITSDGFFQLKEQPRKVAVIGAGYIGVELAGVLCALGSEVSVFGLESRVLEVFDEMVSEAVAASLSASGVTLQLGFRVEKLTGERGRVFVNADGGLSVGPFDAVIWAVGRRPNSDGLGLESVGIEPARNGTVAVNEWQQTSVSSIYAVGDLVGKAPLTPVAVAAGRRLATHLFSGAEVEPVDYEQVASVVFAHPPVATMGLSEAEARRRFSTVSVYATAFTPMKFAFSKHGPETRFKLVCAGDDERIVGLHMVGDGVDEMMQGFAVAITMGACKRDFDRTIAIHPTSAEELVTLKDEQRVANEERMVA